MPEKTKREKIKKAQLLLIIPIVILFVVGIALAASGYGKYYAIFTFIIIFLGAVEAVLAFVRVGISKKESSSNKTYAHTGYTNSASGTSKKEDDNSPEKEKVRKKIWKFDSFVKDNYPKLPLDEITFSKDELSYLLESVTIKHELTEDILKPIVDKMLKHLDQTFNYASIEINKVEPGQVKQAGHIEYNTHKIVVNYDGKMNHLNVLALLAHELSHAYQFYEFSKFPGELDETEEFTDFLTFYLGFGSLVEKGYDYSYCDNQNITHNVRLGYLDDYSLSFSRLTMNGRRTMKEMALEEDEEIKAIKNRIMQINEVMPEYTRLIASFIDNLSHCNNIDTNDLADIGRAVNSYQSIDMNSVTNIVDMAAKETNLSDLKIIQNQINKLSKEVYELYIVLNKMNDKYCG